MVAPSYNARFHLRLLGTNVQNTNFTIFAGIRERMEYAIYRQNYVGFSGTLYLSRYFGFQTQYRYYLGSTPSGSTVGSVMGPRFEYGAFIDFAALRLFGTFIYEHEFGSGSKPGYSATVNGWQLGAQLFF